MTCFPISLPDFPPSTPARLVRNSHPWNSLPGWPLSGESSNFQRLSLSYPICEMGPVELTPKLKSIAAPFRGVMQS